MAKPPSGMLSLTYHLAYDQFYREQWLAGKYADCFAAFGITDAKLQASVSDLNNRLGSADTSTRNALIGQWMALVTDDVASSASNPNILW